jgi:hypothetical protein
MPRVGSEPKIPAFKQAKTVYALDRSATVIGFRYITILKFQEMALLTGLSNFSASILLTRFQWVLLRQQICNFFFN